MDPSTKNSGNCVTPLPLRHRGCSVNPPNAATASTIATDNLISRILRSAGLQDQAEVGAREDDLGRVQLVTDCADDAVRNGIGSTGATPAHAEWRYFPHALQL